MNKDHRPFEMGSVVVPAGDGTLAGLGFDVAALGLRALGLVLETRGKKSLVQFPEIKTTLWLEHDEIADVEAQSSDASYASLIPNVNRDGNVQDLSIIWVAWYLVKLLPVKAIMHFEKSPLEESWGPTLGRLDEFLPQGLNRNDEIWHFSLGVQELVISQWHSVHKFLGDRLLIHRFLPAGLSKIEVLMILKA